MARIRRRLTQDALAVTAKVSRASVSRVEHGRLGQMRLDDVRAIAAVLEIRVQAVARTRALDADRILNARHAALAEHVVRWLGGLDGWVVRAETSYSEYGERGVIDVLGWHAATRSLLVVEVKTELLDFGELLGKLDAKERLARRVVERFEWQAASVSTALVIADSTTNRRRAAEHGGLLHSALPDDGRAFARWLARPVGAVHAIRFVSNVRSGNVRSSFAAPTRVRPLGSGRRAG